MYSNMYSKIISKYQSKYSKKKYIPKIIRRIIPDNIDSTSILGKRNYNNSFTQETFDDFRYGQHIDTIFFEKNIGNAVI
jgi:hypothetical protein